MALRALISAAFRTPVGSSSHGYPEVSLGRVLRAKRSSTRLAIAVFGCVVALGLSAGHAGASTPQYSVVDLGGLGGPDSDAYSLNKVGHVVGESNKTNLTLYYGYLWNGSIHQACTDSFVSARGINSSDVLAGTFRVITKIKGKTQQNDHVGTCQGSTQTDRGLPPGCSDANGYRLNDSGVITGVAFCGSNVPRAFVLRVRAAPYRLKKMSGVGLGEGPG